MTWPLAVFAVALGAVLSFVIPRLHTAAGITSAALVMVASLLVLTGPGRRIPRGEP